MLYQGDASLIPVKNGGTRLIVTSPPFFALRSYTDDDREIGTEPTHTDYLDALIETTAEMARVLSNDGNLFVNVGDRTSGAMANRNWEKINTRSEDYKKHESHRAGKQNKRRDQSHTMPGVPSRSLAGLPWRYAIRCVDELGLRLRAEIIWHKPNPLPDYSTTRRVARAHEQFFHFTKTDSNYAGDDRPDEFMSVWKVSAGRSKVQHTAAFPEKIIERIVSHWSEKGDIVLDPFVGSGTTVRVARRMERIGMGGDINGPMLIEAAQVMEEPEQMRMN